VWIATEEVRCKTVRVRTDRRRWAGLGGDGNIFSGDHRSLRSALCYSVFDQDQVNTI